MHTLHHNVVVAYRKERNLTFYVQLGTHIYTYVTR